MTFATGDLAHFKPGLPPSILYSNAAYQWVEGHIDMFPGLLKLLPSGGQLAIQMPRNHEAPSHALMRQAAQAGPWRDKLAKVGGIRSVYEPGRYYDVLKPLCSDLDVWESIYQQVLTGKDPVAQYTAGTGLRPYMAVLDEAEGKAFYDDLRQAARRGLSDARRRHHAVSLPPPVHRGPPRMMLRRLLVLALALLGAGRVEACLAAPQAMVAAANPLAVDAGLEVLRRGGSAVDAAIAVQMVLGVVEPQASGLGGGGFLLHYDGATRVLTVYDGRETAPAGATPTMFLDHDGKPLGFREATVSGISVGVPGALAMLELAHKEQGKLAWKRVVPAGHRRRARGLRRVAAPCRLARHAYRSCATSPAMRATYFNDDSSPKKVGDRVSNPALAETMQLIADRGAQAFYAGRHRGRDGGARAQPCAARHPVACRSRGIPARQARGGVRSLSRLGRLRHAAAVVGRNRHPAGAGS